MLPGARSLTPLRAVHLPGVRLRLLGVAGTGCARPAVRESPCPILTKSLRIIIMECRDFLFPAVRSWVAVQGGGTHRTPRPVEHPCYGEAPV